MADIIQNGAVSIYQDIELSLTEHLVPPVVHVKQFDHKARKVRCTLYANAVEYTIPSNIILAYSGTRPDGRLFQYSTEALTNDKVDLIGNKLVITITDFMTEVAGRYPVDLVLLDADGDILAAFPSRSMSSGRRQRTGRSSRRLMHLWRRLCGTVCSNASPRRMATSELTRMTALAWARVPILMW